MSSNCNCGNMYFDPTTGRYLPVPPPPFKLDASTLVYPDSANALFVKKNRLMCLLVSAQKGNFLRYGSDQGAYVDGNDILSNGGSGDETNLLSIDRTDGKITLTKKALTEAGFGAGSGGGSTGPSGPSTQAGNLLVTGSDGGAYLGSTQFQQALTGLGYYPGSSGSSGPSSQAGNLLITGSDGGAYFSNTQLRSALSSMGYVPGSTGGSTGPTVSTNSGNILTTGTDGGAMLTKDTVWGNIQPNVTQAINTAVSGLTPGSAVVPSTLISSDAGNAVTLGSDGKLYVALDAGEL